MFHVYITGGACHSGLKFSDVLVLTDFTAPVTDEVRTPTSGEVSRPACGMVRGLRKAGIPVTVVGDGDERTVAAMAARAGPDHVIIARVWDVCGLERPVVVYVDSVLSDRGGRLHAMSRSSAKLLWLRGHWDSDNDAGGGGVGGDNDTDGGR
jgi:hypothetical protein